MKGYVELLVLKSLSEGEKTGYAIMKSLSERTGRNFSYGSIMPALKRLERAGAISCSKGKRKIYRITKKGKEKLGEIEKARGKLVAEAREMMRIISELAGEEIRIITAEDVVGFHGELARLVKIISSIPKEKAGKARKEFREFLRRLKKL